LSGYYSRLLLEISAKRKDRENHILNSQNKMDPLFSQETSPTFVHQTSEISNETSFDLFSYSETNWFEDYDFFVMHDSLFFSSPKKASRKQSKIRNVPKSITFKPFVSHFSTQHMVDTIRSIMNENKV
jgi:hypothetical protein